MRGTKRIILATLLAIGWSASNPLWAQERSVTGRVTSNADGTPVSDVKIRVKGEKEIAATTDANGYYSIRVGANTPGQLIFAHPGYDSVDINVNHRAVVNVALEPSMRFNAYGQQVSRLALSGESRNGFLVFESANQTYRTWFDLRINFDGAKYFDKSAYNKLGDGVTIRRMRFAMKTLLYKHWTGEVDLDFAGGNLEIKDAFLGYRSTPHQYYFKAGYFKEPISMETTTTSRYQTFIEEPYMTEFAPARQLGVNLSKWGTHYLVVGGVHFQDIEEAELTTWSQDENKNNGTDEGISYTGKLVLRPINRDNKVVHLGVAASWRKPKTSWEVPDAYRISMRDMTSINRKKYLDTDNIPFVESYTIFGSELSAAFNHIKFSGEYISTKLNRQTGHENYKASGMYASLSYLVFGGKYSYNTEEGEFSQVTRGRSWGDVEVAVRYDYVNLNDKTASIMGGSANAFTFGVSYHANPNVKFMLNYSAINHDRYANGKGKLYVGRDALGNLTTDYTKVADDSGKAGDDYSFIQLRCEIDF